MHSNLLQGFSINCPVSIFINSTSLLWPVIVKVFVAEYFLYNNNSVDVSVRRVGGAFGGKAKRPKFTAIACALGAHATKRYILHRCST